MSWQFDDAQHKLTLHQTTGNQAPLSANYRLANYLVAATAYISKCALNKLRTERSSHSQLKSGALVVRHVLGPSHRPIANRCSWLN